MSKRKSYMDKSNLINEGFFDKLGKFLKSRPKPTSTKQRMSLLKRIKLALSLSGLNLSISRYEKLLKKQMGDDYPDLPRFTPNDFLE
jgi:hypothetical protein